MLKHGPEVIEDLEPLAGLLKLLSDGTRLRILMLLSKGERNVTSLCNELKLPQPTVSHHLGLLRMKNVISNRRNGKQVFYALDSQVRPDAARTLEITNSNYTIRIAPAVAVAGA